MRGRAAPNARDTPRELRIPGALLAMASAQTVPSHAHLLPRERLRAHEMFSCRVERAAREILGARLQPQDGGTFETFEDEGCRSHLVLLLSAT